MPLSGEGACPVKAAAAHRSPRPHARTLQTSAQRHSQLGFGPEPGASPDATSSGPPAAPLDPADLSAKRSSRPSFSPEPEASPDATESGDPRNKREGTPQATRPGPKEAWLAALPVTFR